MTWSEWHDKSEQLAAAAELARRQGESTRATELYSEAAEAEEKALDQVEPSKLRTFGITAVSTVALHYKAGSLQRAERLAYRYLSLDQLQDFASAQLQELIGSIQLEKVRAGSAIRFGGTGVLVSVQGGEVVRGGAPLDLILTKVQEVRAIVYRTAEMLLHIPHRRRGQPSDQVLQVCRPWLFQAPAGSYQFAVRVEQPSQTELFPGRELDAGSVSREMLRILRATSEDPEGELPSLVPDPDYRSTFLRLARGLAPKGESYSRVEIRGGTEAEEKPVVFVTESRDHINETIRLSRREPPGKERREEVLNGILRNLSLDRDWIEIALGPSDSDRRVKVYEAGDIVDDVIGPMVNRRVIVHTLVGAFGRYSLRDIEPA